MVILSGSNYYPADWIDGGRTLILGHQNWEKNQQGDIVALDLEAPRGTLPTPIIATPAYEGSAAVSPDGRWLLYASDVSGQTEVYLATMPFDGRSWQVSVGGGETPMWDSKGQAYYVGDEHDVYAARLTLEPASEPAIAEPELLFNLKPIVALASWGAVAPLPDGSFVGVAPAAWESEPLALNVIVNWGQELSAKLRGRASGQ